MTTTIKWKDATQHTPDDREPFLVALECGIVIAADAVDGEWFNVGEDEYLRDRVLYFTEWPKHPAPHQCGEVEL